MNVVVNYLETANPFGLARPPAAFLQMLADCDPQLVIFPSLEHAAYRLCRRVLHGPPLAMQLRLHPQKHPDMRVLIDYNLLSVTGIVPFPQWGPELIHDLRLMDMWRVGGSDNFCDALERLEREKAERQDRLTEDESDQRGSSAWFAKKLREGSTTFVQGYTAPHP